MASSLSANSGSLLTLKLSTRCGFSPLARQMRETDAFDTPISRAMVRVDQCVALAGVLCVVFAIRAAVTSVVIDGVRPGRGASFSRPSIPNSRKRPRQSVTMRGATFSAAAICLF
jgi:hypothetical protein